MGLDSIVDVTISTQTTSVARKGFGKPLLVAYFPTSVFAERTREYASLPGMTADGFKATDAAYLMAVALKAQNPSVKAWKVGRRAGASVQTLKVTPTLTTQGEVLRLTVEGTEITYTIPAAATVATICTAMAALLAAIQGVTSADNTTSMQLTPKRVLSARVTASAASAKHFVVAIDGTSYDYLSDADATATEIRDGLKVLIDAALGAAVVTATSSTDALDITIVSHEGADIRVSSTGGSLTLSNEVAARRLLSVGDVSTGLTFKDETPDPSTALATDLAAILAYDTDWYGLGIDCESETQIATAAAWVETQKTLFIPSNIDTEVADGAVTTDVGSDLKAAGYARSGLIKAEFNSQYEGVRWLGKMLAKDPGSATFAYKKVGGATVSSLSAAQEAALTTKRVNHLVTIGGVAVAKPGWSASGEFFDVTLGVDWFTARLQERVWALLVNLDKIAYEVAGELFRAALWAQLEEGRKKGVIAPDTEATPWIIDVPEVADISPADRAERVFPDITFSANLAGAVHTLRMNGTLAA